MKQFEVKNEKTGEKEVVEADYFILKEQQFLIIRKDGNDQQPICGLPASYYSIKLIEE